MKRSASAFALSCLGSLAGFLTLGHGHRGPQPLTTSEMDALRGGDGLGWTCVAGTGACATDCQNTLNGMSVHDIGNPFPSCQWNWWGNCSSSATTYPCTRHFHSSTNCTGPFDEQSITKAGCC